jgi:peptidoglycan/xylan/chitin deacetylase (PgdA/CDA1 family)
VLLYHRVADLGLDPHGLAITPQEFDQQMRQLRDEFSVLPLTDLLQAIRTNTAPPNAVALTFDDGYIDNFEQASPILSRHGLPATFFFTTECLDASDYMYWWDRLAIAVYRTRSELPFAFEGPDGLRSFNVETAAQRRALHEILYQWILAMPCVQRDWTVEQVWAWAGTSPDHSSRRMQVNELLDLAQRPGHEIGAHSVRHVKLPIEIYGVQLDEVGQSKATLEDILGKPVTTFAYPYGAHDSTTTAIVRDFGFANALVCGDAVAGSGSPWEVPRLDPSRRSGLDFGIWLRACLEPN